MSHMIKFKVICRDITYETPISFFLFTQGNEIWEMYVIYYLWIVCSMQKWSLLARFLHTASNQKLEPLVCGEEDFKP